jgi:hypothetical protein
MPSPESFPSRGQKLRWWKTSSGRAAAIALPLGLGLLLWHFNHLPTVIPTAMPTHEFADRAPTSEEVDNSPLATVGITVDGKWDNGLLSIRQGQTLPPGGHALDQGIAEIKLLGGASAVLQAPVQFEILSESSIKLISGQLSANVPHVSRGLTVKTRDLDAVDLGTEFGVSVIPSRKTHLEVFSGRVRAIVPEGRAHANESSIVSSNHAVAVQTGSKIMPDIAAPLAFVRDQELESIASTGGEFGYARWLAFSDELRKDPDLLTYYAFDNRSDAPRKLINRSVATAGSYDATLGLPNMPQSIPEWTQGRWPGKDALEFGIHPQTVVTIPAFKQTPPVTALSFICWLQRTELNGTIHLLTQGMANKRCLNITLTGTSGQTSPPLRPNTIYFDLGSKYSVRSAPSLPSDGQWLMLGVTVSIRGLASFYLNGKDITGLPIFMPQIVRSEDIWLGRSNPALVDTPSDCVFHGRVDELAILGRVLSDQEIQRMYEAGKP